MKSIIYEFDPVIYPYPVLITKQFKAGELAELFYVLDTANNLNEADAEDFLPNGSVIARTLFVVSSMKNKKSIERKLGITSYPEYVLVGGDLRILTRSSRAEDIIVYVTTNLSEYAFTDWAAYLSRAKQLFDSGQVFAAQRIVSACLRHVRWDESFPREVHKVIPRIVATMKDDDLYRFFVSEIKYKYYQGILSEEDVAPFKNEFSNSNPLNHSL